ncbi:hypothetical protein PSECIP111951_03818 [Pseudoalteromonas holothuriae]|uniref:DUF5610 domain-containing protein n=1 Tax=Pseudoalteromonas holothuriae TaxID=2963714 RepID=A0A9W4R521_9GAMM|nr:MULTISPECIES: DUF5610 domain-containing protein [unclassified Pseudoalteromonas]CAH9066457.1 hypothetical protein PSECIP111854_03894 [Pseudoalteromonas sp. CIP111854]CAH9067519.1 hypothetical protein PSECIP111951_03818 [Pseudoalteromonas sp. CIP111951]
MKIGQLHQLLNPAMTNKANKPNVFMPSVNFNSDSYSGDKNKLAAMVLDDKLAQALGIEKKAEKEKPVFDFEAITKNVLDFVTLAVKRAQADGKDDDVLKDMLGAARKGVQMGIDEATDELKGASAFNSEIEQGIEKAKEGIFNGLDEFEEALFNPQSQSMQVSGAQYASLSNQAQYNFQTAEGDEVKITFSDVRSQTNAASYSQKGNDHGFAMGQQSQHEVSFSISVNGELNEQEQQAINEMMEDVRNVSDSFFSGDYEDAFDKAKALNIDNDQIANFTMDLRQSKTTAAISQYQQTNPVRDIEKGLQPLDKQLENIHDQGRKLGIEKQLPDILAWINDGQSRLNEFLDYAQGFFDQLNTQAQDKN